MSAISPKSAASVSAWEVASTSPFKVSICTIKLFTAFQASAGIEQRIYALNSKFLDCKLSDCIGQHTKIGLKYHLFNSTNVHLERASPGSLQEQLS